MTVADSPNLAGPEDWYLRRLSPLVAWQGAVGWLREISGGGGKDYALYLFGTVSIVWLFILPSQLTHALLIAAVLVFGVQMTVRRHKAGLTPRPRGDAALTFAIMFAGIFGTMLPSVTLPFATGTVLDAIVNVYMPSTHTLVSVGLLAACEWMTRQPQQTPLAQDDRWFSHDNLQSVLMKAGLLTYDKDGNLPKLEYKGQKLQRTGRGEFQQVELPGALTWQDAQKFHPQIAKVMGLPIERMWIHHTKGKPEGYVTFGVLAERTALESGARLPECTDWTEPTPIGHDLVGEEVFLRPPGKGHLGIFGATDSGKSWTARYVFSWALLDPRVPVVFISGKDVLEDWQPMRPLCVKYAGGAGDENIRAAVETLRWVDRVINYRKTLPNDERTPMIVGIDEWHMIQLLAAEMDPALGKTVGSLVTRILATARAFNIEVVLIQQKATTESLPAVQRANVTEKLVGTMERASEIGYALGNIDIPCEPSESGEFLYHRAGKQPKLVQIPKMDDNEWVEVVNRAARLRADIDLEALAYELVGETPPGVAVAPAPVQEVLDPLHAAVQDALKRHGQMGTAQVYDRLPEDVRPGGPNVLGRQLKTMPGVRRCYMGAERKPGWEYLPAPRALPRALPAEEQEMPLALALSGGQMPHATGQNGAQEAATGTSDATPRALRALP